LGPVLHHEESIALQRHIGGNTRRTQRAVGEVGRSAVHLHSRSGLDWVTVPRGSKHLIEDIGEVQALVFVAIRV
jgi:hypothetical protein